MGFQWRCGLQDITSWRPLWFLEESVEEDVPAWALESSGVLGPAPRCGLRFCHLWVSGSVLSLHQASVFSHL